MSGYDQGSIAVPMPTVVGSAAALAGPFKIKSSEAFSGALMTVSGLTGETISVQTSPDGYQGAPASPSFYRTDWQGTSLLYSTSRTNLCIYSEQANNAAWAGSNAGLGSLPAVTPDYGISPRGDASADRVVMALNGGTTAGDFSFFQQTYAGFTSGLPYWFSFWAKTNDGSTKNVVISVFNSQVSTVAIGPTWNRYSGTFTPGSTTGSVFGIRLRGTFSSDSADLLFWGMQLEQATSITSYIPTVASPVTLTDYTLSNGVITLAQAPITGATLSYDNSVLPSPYYIFATGDGVRTQFAYDGVWGTLSANSGKGNGIWQIDLRGAQSYQLVKSAGAETATVNMTLKRDALQYKNTAGTWSVT